MESESYMQASALPNSKRFVVEDSITKVTSDGEPHAMMTMVAGLSGLLAAIIILAVLVSMVACRKRKTNNNNNNSRSSNGSSKDIEKNEQQKNAIANAIAVGMTSAAKSQPQLAGNLNAAFAESTLSLSAVDKDKNKGKQKENQWPASIVIERY